MKADKAAWIGCLIVLLSALPIIASAQGFSTVENDLEYRVDYPVEVETGSCVTINFWMKASKDLANLTVSFSVFYHENSEVETLYSNTIISEDLLSMGSTKSKSISICLPSEEPVDPHLRSKIQFYYNGSEQISHEWYMTIVRDETYEELESEVEELEDKISDLKNRIKLLEEDLEEKGRELSQLKEDYESLLSSYISLQQSYQQVKEEYARLEDDYRDLREDYSRLQDSYNSLSGEHQSTLLDLERVNALYESLSKQFDSLEEQYRSLLRDYESTLSELRTYKTMYADLKSRHEDLRSRHEDLIAEAAQLRQRLTDLEEDYSYLSRVYEATLDESSLTKNVLFAQTAAVAAGLGIYAILSRKLARRPRQSEAAEEANSEKKIQKILSGRRVTIPSDAAAKLGLKEGDLVEVDYGNGSIVIRPARREEPEPKPEDGSEKVEGDSGGEKG